MSETRHVPASPSPVTDAASAALPIALRRVMLGSLLAYAVFAFYAAAVRHGLFADGAYVLLKVIENEGFSAFQPARRFAHFLHQLPTIIALRLGVTDLYALTFTYGLTLHLLPLLVTMACYAVLPPGRKIFFVFPYLHFLAGTLASAMAPIAEAPVASAMFWLLLCLTLFGDSGLRSRLLIVACAAGAMLLHEVYAFLGVVLTVAAVYRARRELRPGPRAYFYCLAVWFTVVAGVQVSHVVTPSHVGNRDTFVASFIEFSWLRVGLVPNMPAVLGLAALGAVAGAWALGIRRGRCMPRRLSRTMGVAFALAAIVAIGLPFYSDYFIYPHSQFAARNESAFLSLALAAVLAMVLRADASGNRWVKCTPSGLIGWTAVGSLGWLFVAMSLWGRCVDDARSVLSSRAGLISWEQTLAVIPPSDRRLFSRFMWGWNHASMSMLLAPGGRVASLIDARPDVPWQPFDPTDPSQLPQSTLIRPDAYIEALGRK